MFRIFVQIFNYNLPGYPTGKILESTTRSYSTFKPHIRQESRWAVVQKSTKRGSVPLRIGCWTNCPVPMRLARPQVPTSFAIACLLLSSSAIGEC